MQGLIHKVCQITFEIKSLNSKSIDINTRIPQVYREKELDFRKLIAEQLQRGKVDFSIFVENTGTQTPSKINPNIVKSYIKQMRAIVDGDLTELLKMAVRMPDALQTTSESISEEELSVIFQHINLAITDLQNFRTQEGKVLEKDFVLRINNINRLLQEVQGLDEEGLKITIARYHTPNDRVIDGIGIIPDEIVEPSKANPEVDVQLERAIEIVKTL